MVMNTLTNMIIEALIPHGFLSVRESIVASIRLAMTSRIGSGSARTRMLAILLALIPQRAAQDVKPSIMIEEKLSDPNAGVSDVEEKWQK